MAHPQADDARRSRLDAALATARETRAIEIGRGVLGRVADVFRAQFGDREPAIVSDAATFNAAGRTVQDVLRAAGMTAQPPFVFTDSDLYAQYDFINDLDAWLKGHEAVPIAVGSGTINDLVKLAAHHAGRPYLAVATAASMDGYTAFGASITKDGVKQTFDCPGPVAVVADLDVIAAAPPELNASGYADLLAKNTAGADWIVADSLGVEPIDPTAWELVQGRLKEIVADPNGVRNGDLTAVGELVEGLMLSGLAMQRTKSSRCASGAEHQFSHLWDMQRFGHPPNTPSHGFQVGIGLLAVARLYEQLFDISVEHIDVEALASQWPDEPIIVQQVLAVFDSPRLARLAAKETTAKKPPWSSRRHHLTRIKDTWPKLKKRLAEHLIPSAEIAQMLQEAGAPTESRQIGITPARLAASYRQAYHIRRRYTVLDLAERAGVLDACVERMSE
ncbi:MAG TPA: sn-glycerol-1-phosphate dehydrogenase [Tepidisphaeraceae bacterium]|nr:sn-glycerol-1-phosphate dehydrogenase [Tepidisphaeraceae bacterium]